MTDLREDHVETCSEDGVADPMEAGVEEEVPEVAYASEVAEGEGASADGVADGASHGPAPSDATPAMHALLDDTQVDMTRRAVMPKPAPAPDDGPDIQERLGRLERSASRLRVAVAVLAVLLVASASVGAAAVSQGAERLNGLSAQAAATEETLNSQIAELEERVSELAEKQGTSIIPWGGSSESAVEEEGDEPLRAAQLAELVGEKWSNAQRILEAYGVDSADLVVITDDGGRVFDASNWTVTMVVDMEETGQVAVHLRHDTAWS